ncbi:MAG TPA: sulfurtransferase [Gammaproteobacteria bacterium]|nr:sulfurtransferase [Gammaproteobacteria bacterium]
MVAPLLPIVVEPEQLQPVLGDPRLLLVDLSDPANYVAHHLPGAVNLPFPAIISPQPPAMGMLPDTAQLSAVLSAVGLTEDRHVVAYDGEGSGRASRLLWTLDALGHPGLSLLDGGLAAWAAAGGPLESGNVAPQPSQYVAKLRNPAAVADLDYIRSHLGDSEVIVLDTRSAAEYSGVDQRAARAGHIPGAVNFDWTRAMDPQRHRRLLPAQTLRSMLQDLGVTPDKEVITHCQTHHRSAHTYVMLKHLGYDRVRGYPGSWSEWGNRDDTPVER